MLGTVGLSSLLDGLLINWPSNGIANDCCVGAQDGPYGGRNGVDGRLAERVEPPDILWGVLCTGASLREINHRSFAGACRARELNQPATGQLARNGKPCTVPLSRVLSILRNGEFAEVPLRRNAKFEFRNCHPTSYHNYAAVNSHTEG